MRRSLVSAALMLALPAVAAAQLPLSTPGSFGGGPRPATPLPLSTPTVMMPRFPAAGGIGGGFFSLTYPGKGFPFPGIWGGYGYSPYAYPPVATTIEVNYPVLVPVPPVEQSVVLANEFPAELELEFPAPAEVWVNGKKGEGEPTTEWTLTSPTLDPGDRYTFDVKARWKADGKTLEYTRSFTVTAGERSRAHVLAGTPIKE